ncbi:hypothetical protein ACFWMJ_05500 [Streptomyces hawaiiensis]|uniref:hypothetical protein n=1 Tax=Streptomyces hawaiiensis TaxID=67305 RepID=UPI00365029E2
MRKLITSLLAGASAVAMAAITTTPADAAPARYQWQNARNTSMCLASYSGTVSSQACLPAHSGLSWTHWVFEPRTDIQRLEHPISPQSDRCLDTDLKHLYNSPCSEFDYGTRWATEPSGASGNYLIRAYDGRVVTRWDNGTVSLAWTRDVDDPRKYQWKPVF